MLIARTPFFCVAFALLFSSLPIQAGTIVGTVVTSSTMQGAGIAGARVHLVEVDRYGVADSAGRFVLNNVPEGSYMLAVHSLGYAPLAQRVMVTKDTSVVTIELSEKPMLAREVVVSAERDVSTTQETPLAVSVLEGRALDARRGQSLAGTLDLLPGVREYSGGPISSKPVIRGLSSQRVLIAQNGVRMGSQTWDDPQAPEMSLFNVDRIEVVRGPNSAMFGSDALGGVVNVIRPSVFAQPMGKLNGNLVLNGFSNPGSGAGAITVGSATETSAFSVSVNARALGEYSTPSGTLPNGTAVSGGEVFNSGGGVFGFSAAAGTRGHWGSVTLDLSHYGQEMEITPEPGRMEVEINPTTGVADTMPASPEQEIMHERAVLSSTLFAGTTRFDIQAGYQYNSRKEEGVSKEEEDEEEEEHPEVKLDLYTATLDAKAVLQDIATVGISVLHQRNQTLGRHAIIPNYTQLNLAGYIYREQKITDDFRAMASVRLDHRTLDASQNALLATPASSLDFDAFTGNLGLSWSASKYITLTGNVGSGWRAPVAAELFGNGEDEGEVRYKQGNATLTPERSLNVELGAKVSASSARMELAMYRNSITDYIGLRPTNDVHEGLPVYSYFQTNATILGVEWTGDVDINDWLTLGAGFDALAGIDRTLDTALPLMPANRIMGRVTYHCQGWDLVKNFSATLQPRHILQQDRVASGEIVTPSYTLVDVFVGGLLELGGTQFRTDLVVQNLFNAAYADHLSRYKKYALNPGINVSLRIAVPIF